MKKFLIGFVVLAAIAGTVSLLRVFRTSSENVGNKKADFEIGSQALVSEFDANEEAANTMYIDKIILVEGTVSSIDANEENLTIYLKDEADISGVICNFSKDADIPPDLSTGNRVKIKGVCTGYLLDVILNKCSIE